MGLRSEFNVSGAASYSHKGPMRWILSHLARHPLFLLGSVLGKGLSLASYSSVPILIGLAADEVLSGDIDTRLMLTYGLVVFAMMFGDSLANLLGSLSLENVAQRLEAGTRDELYRSLLAKSQTFHDRQRVGDIMARATDDVRNLNPMVNPGFAFIYESALAFIIPMIVIATVNLQLLIIPVAYALIFGLLLKNYTDRLYPVAGSQREAYGTMNAGLEETISGIEIVKASASESFERGKYQKMAREFRKHFVEQGRLEAGYLPLLVYGVAMGGIFLHALLLYTQGVITIGGVITTLGLMRVLEFPTFISIFSFSLVQMGLASGERVLSMIKEEADLDQNDAGHKAPMKGAIEFEAVSFGYAGTAFGVSNISFNIEPGQTVAIVGQTGSGKSTLTQLVNRTYDVGDGVVRVDGVDVRKWDLDSLRSQIGKIEQDVFLFSRSIAENIAFGRPDATREEIEAAAQAAQAHEFIMSFKDGYATVVGERGTTLSGGQRQRIALARAFLSNPPILILDDSTSAIDSATEDEIQKALRRIQQGRTTLLITHRLSQIRWADRILVLDQGELVAWGAHDDLISSSPHYRRIFARYEAALPPVETDEAAAR